MTDLILHHFDLSPYAEKIRKVFGIKNLTWNSVQIPMIMPKPDLMPLTGGYRKTPVLQIGADIYCDTALIIDVIEDLHPSPPMFKSGRLSNYTVQSWGDSLVFPFSAALSLHENAENLPKPLVTDRKNYFSFLDFDSFAKDAPHFRAQFRAHAKLLDEQLSDSRLFLLGEEPEWADINAYFNIWTARGNFPSSERLLNNLKNLETWYERVAGFGEGQRTEISSTDALLQAKHASPAKLKQNNRPDESGIAINTNVSVTPTDHGAVPVTGTLDFISDQRITLRRKTSNFDDLCVHFPRIGYRIEKLHTS